MCCLIFLALRQYVDVLKRPGLSSGKLEGEKKAKQYCFYVRCGVFHTSFAQLHINPWSVNSFLHTLDHMLHKDSSKTISLYSQKGSMKWTLCINEKRVVLCNILCM